MRDLSKCMPSKQVVQPLIHIIRHGLPGDDPQDVLSLPSDWLLQSLERSGVQTRCRTASSTHGSTLAPLSGRRARPSGRCRASRSLCTVFSRLSRETQRLMDSCRHRREGPRHPTDANDSTLLPDGVPLLDAPTGGPLLESIRSSCVLTPQGIVQGLAQVCVCAFGRFKHQPGHRHPVSVGCGSMCGVCSGTSSTDVRS